VCRRFAVVVLCLLLHFAFDGLPLVQASAEMKSVTVRDCGVDRCIEISMPTAQSLPSKPMFLSFQKPRVKVSLKDAGGTYFLESESGYADFDKRFVVLNNVKKPRMSKLKILLSPSAG